MNESHSSRSTQHRLFGFDANGIANPPVDPLRPTEGTEHDELIKQQIHDAVSFVSKSTGVVLADLGPLRAAIVALTRELYDGQRELSADSAVFGLMDVFRSYKHAE